MLDNDVIDNYKTRAKEQGLGYQTLINQDLRKALGSKQIDEEMLRRILREEIVDLKRNA